MAYLQFFAVGMLVFSLLGCSTAPIAPSISDFAEATNAAATAGAETFDDSRLDARIADAERANMVRDQAGYAPLDITGGDCAPVFPSELDPDQTRGFDEACPLAPVTLGPNDEFIPYERGLDPVSIQDAFDDSTGPNAKLTYERNARRALSALSEYAVAINALASSDVPENVGMSLGRAVTAVKGLAETAATINDDKGISPETTKILTAAPPFFETFAREVLEARRYALLSEVVRAADPLVQDLAQAAALWFYQQEKDELIAAYKAARGAAEVTALPQTRTVATIAAADAAIANARKAEAEAQWRVFWSIAQAHRGILNSFDAPPDLERLADANARIQKLIKVTDNFVKTIEAAKE